MTAQQGSAGGRGPGGGPPKGSGQGVSNTPSPATAPSTGTTVGRPTAQQEPASRGVTSPAYTEGASRPQSVQAEGPAGSGGPGGFQTSGSAPAGSRKGCTCCGGTALLIMVVATLCVYFAG